MQKKRLTRQEYIDMTEIQRAAQGIKDADALLIGASNGLSIAESYHIFANNEMFRRQFGDIQQKYGIRSVIEGCFYPYPNEKDRQEFLNRLVQHWVTNYRPSQVMKDLLAVAGDKDYFILTSNADTHLELSGFAPGKVFEVEGTFEDMLHNRPMQDKSQEAVYITLNLAQELYIPNEIAHKSIGLAGDIAVILQKLKEKLV